MQNDKQALNLFKTYMVLGPDYQHGRQPKLVFPKSITHMIMQYAQYEDWIKTANDLAALLKRNNLNYITQSESWAQDESLNNAKKWLANPNKPHLTDSYDFFEQSIMPLIKFIAKSPLVNEFGWTALMFAAYYDHTEALKALLAVPGINVNAMNPGGMTALMFAAYNRRTEALKALLAVPGIDVNAVDKQGLTALMWVVSRGAYTAPFKALLATPGIDVNAKTKLGWTVLTYLENFGRAEALRLINEHIEKQVAGTQNKSTFN